MGLKGKMKTYFTPKINNNSYGKKGAAWKQGK